MASQRRCRKNLPLGDLDQWCAMPAHGNDSIRALLSRLVATFGDHSFDFGSPITDEQDAFGGRLLPARKFAFSISTHAGGLPFGTYDMQVAITDNSLSNGDIIFDDETNADGVVDQIERLLANRPVA